ncbi:MAG: tetratricopeptide repeat protein [Phycisphaerales bacterium]|jgi:TolA-binding protein|nr:tetratricopeptide repeat protein [Phycisphaerales bacterium]
MADLHAKRSQVFGIILLMLLATILPATLQAQEASTTQPKVAESGEAIDLFYNANSLYHRRFYKQAVDEYKSFLTKYPEHTKVPKVKWGLAISLYCLGKPKEAEPLMAGLVGNTEIKAQDQLHNLWGSCLLGTGQVAKSEKAFAWTLENTEDKKGKFATDARAGLVEAFYLQKKWKELVKVSDELLELTPKSRNADKIRFQGAVARSELGNHDAAATVFATLIETSKNASLVHQAMFRLAWSKQLTGKLASAAAMYDKVAKTSKGFYSENAYYNLAVVCFLQKQYAKAIEELLGFSKAYPKSNLGQRVRLYLGRSYLETKDYKRAVTCLKQLSVKSDIKAPATLWLARAYSRQNSNATVVTILAPVIETFDGSPEMSGMLNEYARAQMNLNKFPEAAVLYGRARAISKPPESTEYLRLQAFCLNRSKQYEASMKLTDELLAAGDQPNKFEIMFVKAENLRMLTKYSDALTIYTKLLGMDPKNLRVPLINFRIARIHWRDKKWTEAAASLETLLAGDHRDAAFKQAGFILGDCYFRMGDKGGKWAESIAAFETFLQEQSDANNVDAAIFNLALACQKMKLNAKAIAILREMVTSGSYTPRDDKGVAIVDADNKKRDKQAMRAVLAKKRHYAEACVELGRLLYMAGVYPEAKKHLEAAMAANLAKKASGDGNPEYYLGWVHLKQNQLKEAAGYFGKVAAFPDHPFASDAALQCSILHLRNKDIKSAEAALKKLMSGPNPIKADQGAYYLGLAIARQETQAGAKKDTKRYLAALGYFDTVLTKYPKSDKISNALYWRGKCVENLPSKGGAKKAVEIYADFIEKYPKHDLAPDAMIDMGNIQFAAKKYDSVITAMKALLDPEAEKQVTGTVRVNALYLLGWSYSKTNQTEASAAALEEMTKLKGAGGQTSASASFQAGEARRKLNDYVTALKHFRLAASHKGPNQAPAMLRQAECEGLTGKWSESQKTCIKFLELFPASPLAPQVTFALGWAEENSKKYPEAIEQYRKVIARKKNDEISARSQFQIGECLFMSDKLDQAITELIRVETKYSFPEWSAMALLELGRIRESQKNEDEAVKRYTEVVDRFPKSRAATVAKSLLRKLQ